MKKFLILTALVFLAATVSAATINFNFDVSKNQSIAIPGIIYDDSVVFQVSTTKSVLCRYSSAKGRDFSNMEGSFDDNFEILHKKSFQNLHDGVYRYYVRCRDINDVNNNSLGKTELEAVFRISNPIKAQISLEEGPLKEGKYEISLTTTKVPSQTPYLGYSFDSTTYYPILLQGTGTSWKGYLIISGAQRDGVGVFKFSAKDLEGRIGTKIIGRNSFVVDTKKPKTPNAFDAKGEYGQILLEWAKAESDTKKVNIYRSQNPPVKENDLIASVDGSETSYLDTSVENGKTYFYRIDFEDEAGNIGDFSREVRATALLSNSSSSQKNSKLSPELIGKVDSLLTELSLLEQELRRSKENLDSLKKEEKAYLGPLGLTDEISGAEASLNSLRREIEGYKLQDLTEQLLDSKISSSRLRLNGLKKRIPETFQLIDSAEKQTKTGLDEIRSVIVETRPELESYLVDTSAKNSFEISKNLDINSKMSVFQVLYLDGSKKAITFIEHEVSDKSGKDYTLYLRWPESLLEGPKIKLKNSDYNKEKENLVSFDGQTKKISYLIEKKLSTDALDGIKISAISIAEKGQSITGYFLSLPGTDSIGTTFLLIVASTLGIYLIYIRRKKQGESDIISDFISKARTVKKLSRQGKTEEASRLYRSLQSDYLSLSPEEKRRVFKEVRSLSKNG